MIVIPAVIFGGMIWSGISAWRGGAAPSSWTPLVAYGALLLALSYIPTVGRWVGDAPDSVTEPTSWQLAFWGVAVAYLFTGLIFLSIGYTGVFVVGNAVLAAILLAILVYTATTGKPISFAGGT